MPWLWGIFKWVGRRGIFPAFITFGCRFQRYSTIDARLRRVQVVEDVEMLRVRVCGRGVDASDVIHRRGGPCVLEVLGRGLAQPRWGGR